MTARGVATMSAIFASQASTMIKRPVPAYALEIMREKSGWTGFRLRSRLEDGAPNRSRNSG